MKARERAKEENKARVKESKSERGGERETFVSVFASRESERKEEKVKRRMRALSPAVPARQVPLAFPCVNYTCKAIITLLGLPLTGKMKAAYSSARLSHRLKIIVFLLHFHRPR